MRVRGFSLAELVVALGFFALPLLFLIGLLTTNFALQAKSQGILDASHVAESLMEEWKARPYAELEALSASPPLITRRVVDDETYDCSFLVRPLQPAGLNPNGRVLQLEATVTWEEQSGLGEKGTRTTQAGQMRFQSVVSPGGVL